MPSRSVDVLWHEFILHTKVYDEFCPRAYGRKLHHTPARSMTTTELVRLKSRGLGWTYALASRDEGLSLGHPSRLPLLFRVDEDLAIPDAQHWILSCGQGPCGAGHGSGCIQHSVRPLLPLLPPKLPAQGRRDATGRFVPLPRDLPAIEPFGVDCGGFGNCGG